MVDELLKEELLASPGRENAEALQVAKNRAEEIRSEPQSQSSEIQVGRKPLPSLPPALPTQDEDPSLVPSQEKLQAQEIVGHGLQSAPSASELPSLPNWSPLIFDQTPLPQVEDLPSPSVHSREDSGNSVSEELEVESEVEEKPVRRGSKSSVSNSSGIESPRRNNSTRLRPHISRDKILERVAKEKEKRFEFSKS